MTHPPLSLLINRALLAVCILQASIVMGVSLTGCSNINTGGDETSSYFMTNGLCSDTCKGYVFAITQDSNCWCSNYAPSSEVALWSCNSACPGYPYEFCGNADEGLYGYIALGGTPSGTSGGLGGLGGLTASSTSYTSSHPTSATSYSTPTTEFSSSAAHTTTGPNIPIVVTQTQRLTVSGSVVTSLVTSTPTDLGSTAHSTTGSSKGLSGGAIAGIVIGVLLVVALAAVAIFFFWRSRRSTEDDKEGAGLARNPSVLSGTGLLGRPASGRNEYMGSTTPTLPRLDTKLPSSTVDPGSARTGSSHMSESRRNSRPMFVDSRLNPNTMMWQGNSSLTSIGTLQDNQDYSRPLEVRNPDR